MGIPVVTRECTSRAHALSHKESHVMGVTGNLWIVVKDVKTLVVYDVE